MRSQIALGRIHGIRIGLHYSWFLIALLLFFSLYAGFHRGSPQGSPLIWSAWAGAATLLFFLSLLLHELSHSLLALRYGLHVREITLFALGGVSQIEGEVPTAASEFRIAIAGPLTSAALGILFLALVHLPGLAAVKPLAAMLLWLGYINLLLAVFNLLPGYPMDGGRVLRAFLWSRSGNLEKATRTAALAGNFLAITFIAAGIIDYFRGGGLGGLWIAFLGWFLLQASREAHMELLLKQELRDVRVSGLMISRPATVDAGMTVQNFVDHELLRSGRRCFVVEESGRPTGILTLHDLRRVDRACWSGTPVRAIMRSLADCEFVKPEAPLLEALATMTRQDVNQLPVISEGNFVGLISRNEVLAYLQTRAELDMLRTSRHSLGTRRDDGRVAQAGGSGIGFSSTESPLREPRFRRPR
ncbi:MAG: M50 family metallopeptidase [Acidobacteriota bacterium]